MMTHLGKYEILGRIGRGGMGTVFKARDPVLDRVVALKIIATDTDATPELKARFFREAQATARLNHESIVTVYDIREDNGQLFIVMEFLDGIELKQLMAERPLLALAEKLSIMLQVCGGLAYAHEKGIIHRDIKPGNIFILRSGAVKILDFGLAQMAGADRDGLTRTGLILGTLRYMSPEQARGRGDHRSDIFSLGAVFYELLANRPPFCGADPIQILESLRSEDPTPLLTIDSTMPPELALVIERALQKDPADRYQALSDMYRDLQSIQQRIHGPLEALPSRREQSECALSTSLKSPPPVNEAQLETPQDRAIAIVASARDRLERNDVTAAAEDLRRALELDPDLPEAHALKEEITAVVNAAHQPGDAGREASSIMRPAERIVRYQIIRAVGRGPSGPVYRAWDLVHERMVALKSIDDAALSRERLLRAAQAWLRLEPHPNVIRVLDVDDHEGVSCIVMEFLDGWALDHVLANRQNLSLQDKLSVITQVCEGVTHLHRSGLIHQDIRPSSIFVLVDGQVKLLDSGIARQALPVDTDVSRTRFLLDDYRAPEQARGRTGQRSDMYSVGRVALELLTDGRLPGSQEAHSVREQLAAVRPPLPPELIDIVDHALQVKPGDRFRSMIDMRDELNVIRAQLSSRASEQARVLFAIHGIRTHGAWQKAVMEVAQTRQWYCRSFRWSYGYFSLLQFLLPWRRATKVEWFRETYDSEIKNREVSLPPGVAPSIVAHSFGTLILGNALLANKHIRFNRIILCGSILPRDFPWDTLMQRDQVQGVRNEYGTKDVWPRMVRWFVRGSGPSGRHGFECRNERVEQEEFLFSHSAYFDKGHMEANWFPFLESVQSPKRQPAVSVRTTATNVPFGLYLLYGLVLLAVIWGLVQMSGVLSRLFDVLIGVSK